MLPPRPFLWRVREEWRHFVRVNPPSRPWQMPASAAFAAALPVAVGAWFGRMDYGTLSSLAGMIFLYLPETPLEHRMVWLMSCGFGLIGCFALGTLGHFVPVLIVPFLAGATALVAMLCRYYRVGPPGPTFFVMGAAIGAFSPVQILDVPTRVGLFALGAVLSSFVALGYSVYILRLRRAKPPAPHVPAGFDVVVMEPLLIGLAVGVSLAIAQAVQLERPYWVPVSCLAVIQGISLRAVWVRQLHRILGTCIGLGVAWVLIGLPLNNWEVVAMIFMLTLTIETLVVRHYGIAVIFITPLTIILAEAATLGQASPDEVLAARLLDTVLGSVVGFAGGAMIHSPPLRAWLRPRLMKLWPAGFAAPENPPIQ